MQGQGGSGALSAHARSVHNGLDLLCIWDWDKVNQKEISDIEDRAFCPLF